MRCPVIVALDVPTKADAGAFVHALGPSAGSYKVGLQLLTAAGPDAVRELVAQDKDVCLDLKLHEIPNAVAGAVRAAGQLGVRMVTVHASAGSAVLRAAVQVSPQEARDLAALLPAGTLIVTPGIQRADDGATDQARVATPQAARRAGATHIVVGRSVTQAARPERAFHAALAAMDAPRGA